MFVILFIMALTSSANATPAICPIDPEYSCCQQCSAKEMICRAKEADLSQAMACSQSKKNCEKQCEKKMDKLNMDSSKKQSDAKE